MTIIHDIRNETPKRATKRNVNDITTIVRHHSATTQGDFWSFWNNRWKGLGWQTGGYAEIILRDGSVQLCYDPAMVTNGASGANNYSYHICLVGNGSFTALQEQVWVERAAFNMARFNVTVEQIKGHGELPNQATACPGINMNTVRNRLRNNIDPGNKAIGSVRVTASSLWVYDKKDWNARHKTVGNGEVFTVVAEHQVNNALMLELLSGLFITGNTSFVAYTRFPQQTNAKENVTANPYQGKTLRSKVDGLRFYDAPRWDQPSGTFNQGQGFPRIIRKLKVGNGEQFEVENSKGRRVFVTAHEKYVYLD